MGKFTDFITILCLTILSLSGLISCLYALPKNATHGQLANNFQGSGSLSMLDTVCMSILLKRDTVLAINCGTISHVFVLTTRIVNNVSVDGETYKTLNAGQPIDLHADGLMIYKFGPLSPHSDAVPATLPPKGSHPPTAGTECMAYTYTTEDVSGNVFVSYSPVIIADPETCGGNSDFFCIQVMTPSTGTNGFFPVLIYCRRSVWNFGHNSGYPDWLYAGGLQEVRTVGSVMTFRMYYITNLLNVADL